MPWCRASHKPKACRSYQMGKAEEGRSVLLVVGHRSSGKKALVQGLLHLTQECGPSGSGSTDEPASQDKLDTTECSSSSNGGGDNGAQFQVHSWIIDTPYYRAPMEVRVQVSDESDALPAKAASLEGVEGLVVMFDLSKDDASESFELVQGWGPLAAGCDRMGLRLCVGAMLDKANGQDVVQREARRRACIEWCLDHGFEYIEACCTDAEAGGDDREKEGLPRVLEALQSNMWSSMEFKGRARPQGSLLEATIGALLPGGSVDRGHASSTDSSVSGEEVEGEEGFGYSAMAGDDDHSGAEEDDDVQQRQPQQPETDAGGDAKDGLGLSAHDWEAADAVLRRSTVPTKQEMREPPHTAATTATAAAAPMADMAEALLSPGGGGASTLAYHEAGQMGGGGDDFDMESLMREVQMVRSMGEQGRLSDAQRREMAAATATKLLGLLGLEEDDEDGNEL